MSSGWRLADIEERSRHGRVEDAIALDLVVHVLQAVAVAVHGEVRNRPDHLAKEEHHRSHVEEREAKALVPAVNDLQADCPGLIGLELVVSPEIGFEGSEEVLADLDVGPAGDVLREVRAPPERAPWRSPTSRRLPDGGSSPGRTRRQRMAAGAARGRRPRRHRADEAARSPSRRWAATPLLLPASGGSSQLPRRRAPRHHPSGCPAQPSPRRAAR